MRLVGDPLKGAIVEVYDGISRWGQICPDTWMTPQAQYVCRQFGYAGFVAAIRAPLQDTQLNNSTTMKLVQLRNCNPETSFFECMDAMSTECDCSVLNAGVVCSTSPIGIYIY